MKSHGLAIRPTRRHLIDPFCEFPPIAHELCPSKSRDAAGISLYERYLTAKGYYIVPLTDPTRAKELVLALKPYAVTLDIMMPNKDGWQVLTEIKSDPATREVPVVVCSIVEQEDKGFGLGAADYLLKPILEDDLVHAMYRLNREGEILEVLIIDDDPHDLRLMEKALLGNGHYRPILAQGGRAGWDMLKTRRPNAIILDLFMPDLDGFTILERMRSTPRLRDIPVVVSGFLSRACCRPPRSEPAP